MEFLLPCDDQFEKECSDENRRPARQGGLQARACRHQRQVYTSFLYRSRTPHILLSTGMEMMLLPGAMPEPHRGFPPNNTFARNKISVNSLIIAWTPHLIHTTKWKRMILEMLKLPGPGRDAGLNTTLALREQPEVSVLLPSYMLICPCHRSTQFDT